MHLQLENRGAFPPLSLPGRPFLQPVVRERNLPAMRRRVARYVAAVIAGILVWVGVSAISGEREAWDSGLYFLLGLPFLVLLAGSLGFLDPVRGWKWGMAPFLAQALWVSSLDERGQVWPFAWLAFSLLSIPAMVSATIGAFLARRRVQQRHGAPSSVLPQVVSTLLWLSLVLVGSVSIGEGALGGEGAAEPSAGRELAGLSFRLFVDRGSPGSAKGLLDEAQAERAIDTVADTFAILLRERGGYPRFDEAIRKGLLDRVVIEPTVLNREGKAFPFLVTRTAEAGRVRLMISARSLKEQGYLGQPDRLAPVLGREFQWVVSKADTAPKPTTISAERDLARAPIASDKEIRALSGEERGRLLQRLFETYLRTVDDLRSLDRQAYYEVGTSTLLPTSQPDAATKWYDIRVREALQRIVREPSFLDRTPQAVFGLLNGKIWTVAFVKIDQRDWATRTRVLPEDKAIVVGEPHRTIQPASVLVNMHRTATPDDPFYPDAKQLPMGALSTEQLALVIAKEIQLNLTEKSQPGHVLQDALTAPK